jgi:zinc-finger-containing domain
MTDGDPQCPYCGNRAQLLTNSAELYQGRDYGPVWICRQCDAWVGVHKNSYRPLGRLANAQLRQSKIRAHAAFDRLWLWRHIRTVYRDNVPVPRHILVSIARKRAYLWLAERMAISPAQCHIGMFDIQQCQRVVEVIRLNDPTPQSIRAWAKDHGHGHTEDGDTTP